MPSIRKRIGYLPSINSHEMIIKISTKEKLSQSKVVGILVEEALIARDKLNVQNSNHFIKNDLYREKINLDQSSLNINDLDEFISDKGITYNTKKHKNYSENNLLESKENYNVELFEQFKQFLMFQEMIQDK